MAEKNVIQFEPTMFNHTSGMWCPHCDETHFKYVALLQFGEPIQIFECLVCFELFWDHWGTESTDGTLEVGEEIKLVEVKDA